MVPINQWVFQVLPCCKPWEVVPISNSQVGGSAVGGGAIGGSAMISGTKVDATGTLDQSKKVVKA